MRIQNLLQFRKDDPLRYLHVPANERLETDEGGSEELAEDIDIDWYLEHPDGVDS